MGVDQLRLPGQRHRHRVDREVPAREVALERRRLDLRERPRLRIALRPGRGQVDPDPVQIQRSRWRSARERRSRRRGGARSPARRPRRPRRGRDGRRPAAGRGRRRRPGTRAPLPALRAAMRRPEPRPCARRAVRGRSWSRRRAFRSGVGRLAYHDMLLAGQAAGQIWRSWSVRTACHHSRRRGDRRSRPRRARVRAPEAPARRLEPRCRVRRRGAAGEEAGEARGHHRRLADVRLQRRPHPLLRDRRRQAAVQAVGLELPERQAARVLADHRRRRPLLPGLRGPRLRAGRGEGEGHLAERHRREDRLLSGLCREPPVRHEPRAGTGRGPARARRQGALAPAAARAAPSPRRSPSRTSS